MKVKKVLFYAAPVALAGFLYIGEATGIGEVLAKNGYNSGKNPNERRLYR